MSALAPVFTLTPNPSLDETWQVEAFHEDRINRVDGVRLDPGGKGINVSRLLRVLGVDAPAAGFAGGENGRALRKRLVAEGIPDAMTDIAGETRRNLTLQIGHEGRTVKINHPGPEILPAECRRMADRLEETLTPGSLLAVCGSLPPGMGRDEITALLARLSVRGVRICVDCEALDRARLCVIRPFMVKLNQQEFEALVSPSGPLSGRADVLSTAASLARDTGAIVVVTRGGDGAVAATPEERRMALAAPPVGVCSTVGAGDALLGGLLAVYAGWHPDGETGEDDLLARALRIGVACGAAKTALPGTDMPMREAVLARYRQTGHPVPV
ncbi:MAG: hexose kinase [Clostridiaceae bacterium]|nr:hexose kinase [Clostridiaceae bacterium]